MNKARINPTPRIDLTGKRFGRLLVLSREEEKSVQMGRSYFLCRCDCSKEKVVGSNSLRSNLVKSCGCWKRDKLIEQNLSGKNHPAYFHGFDYKRAKFRKAINLRDKVCQYKGEHKGRLEAHHLDGDGDNHSLGNGTLLCCHHHKIVTNDGNVWRPNHE